MTSPSNETAQAYKDAENCHSSDREFSAKLGEMNVQITAQDATNSAATT